MTPPAGSAAEPTPEWSGRVSEMIDEIAGEALEGVDLNGRPAPFYNPLSEELEADEAVVKWSALSGTLRALDALPPQQRWELADQARLDPVEVSPGLRLFGQDEYCEWAVARDAAGEITEVIFTTEVGDWFEHLARTDRAALVAAYREILDADVEEEQLFVDGSYDWLNQWNLGVDGKIVHLAQENNHLGAAIRLAAEASVARTRDDEILTDAGALMACNGLGNADRFSDPSIATTINATVVGGARVALAPPLGLYLDGIRTEGMRLPAGHEDLDPADLWDPQRGADGRVVRARFAPPDGADFTLADVRLDGEPIVTGAQLAERVEVKIVALVHQAEQEPVTKDCA